MIHVHESPRNDCFKKPFVPSENGTFHRTGNHAGVFFHAHGHFRNKGGSGCGRVLFVNPVENERTEVAVVEQNAQTGEKAEPDVLHAGFHAFRQNKFPVGGHTGLP